MRILSTIAVSVGLLGCGGRTAFENWTDSDASATPASIDGGDAASSDANVPIGSRPLVTLKWGTCERAYSGADECATFAAPLLGVDMSKTVSVHVAHIKSLKAGAPQVWMLQGGPGGSGVVMVELAKIYMRDVLPDAEYFAVDHRGTGLSSNLDCTADAASDCVSDLKKKWGADGLSGFSTTQAARDVDQLIASTRKPSQQAFVYGVSYGTYWAHRVLQVAQQPISGVILDSFSIPGSTFANTNNFFDGVFKTLVEDCVRLDTTCASRLGANPWQFVQITMAAHKAGALCKAAGLSHTGLKNGLASYMQRDDIHGVLPALIYRLSRCTTEDQSVLRKLDAGDARGQSFYSDEEFSTPLYFNVVMGELWPSPSPSRDALNLIADSKTIANASLAEYPSISASWPRYPSDPFVGAWYAGAVPILTLNSALDVQTPAEEARQGASHFVAPGQTYVEFPYNDHGVILDETGCAARLIANFMRAPSSRLDTSCTGNTNPPRFTDDALMRATFGANATWQADVRVPPKDVLPKKSRFRFGAPRVFR